MCSKNEMRTINHDQFTTVEDQQSEERLILLPSQIIFHISILECPKKSFFLRKNSFKKAKENKLQGRIRHPTRRE